MHYPRQEDRATNPQVKLPFKFTGGFGIDVRINCQSLFVSMLKAETLCVL